MTEQVSPVAASLQLDNHASLHRFVRAITGNLSVSATLHLYEHRSNTFSVHGTDQVHLCITLLRADTRPPVELPSVPNSPSIETLILDPREACSLAATALFTAGRKVVVWNVSSDGRISSRMDGTPGCPGTLTSWLGERPDDGVVLAVRPTMRNGLRVLGLAVWEPSSATLHAADVLDDDAFAALDPVFVASNARELVIPDDLSDFDRVKVEQLAEDSNLALTVRKRKSFDGADVAEVVHRLVGGRHVEDAILDGKVAAAALAALIEYCELDRDPSLEGRAQMKELTVAGSMKLDNGVMRALNILPFPGDGGKRASLFGLLNRCRSAMGSRLLRRWLSQPLQSIEEINDRLDIVEAFVKAPDCRRSVREDHIAKLPDVNLLCRRFTKDGASKASLQDVVRMYQCSVRLPFICDQLSSEGDDGVLMKRYVDPLRKLAGELSNFEALVETTVDLEQIDNGEFVVSPNVDPELGALREKQDEIIVNIEEEYQKTMSSISGLKGDGLKLERKDNLGYIFRLTRKEEKLIRGKKQFTVLETRKDGVRFQTKTLRRLSDSYQGVAEEYHAKESEMRAKTLEVAGTYVEVFVDVAALIAEIDVLCAFGVVAEESRAAYVRPKLTPSGTGLHIQDARHPIVEENLSDDVEFISNSIDLRRATSKQGSDAMEVDTSKEGDGGCLLLVTGPNMGGKSTYIRSAGVITLMAHVGCFVPASEARVPLTDRIFARVGAGDNQHRALSTFMAEMVETAVILRSATWKSLVIIDELGRGTGTTDGYGLAHAIGKHISTEIRCGCLFATHFFELTALAEEVADVNNAHVSAVTEGGNNGLTFLYEVREGACDQSFGVHVAEMAGFPPDVVIAARRKADELEGGGAVSKRSSHVSDEQRAAGWKLLEEFEKELAGLPCATPDEVKSSLERARVLRKELLAHGNSFVTALVSGR